MYTQAPRGQDKKPSQWQSFDKLLGQYLVLVPLPMGGSVQNYFGTAAHREYFWLPWTRQTASLISDHQQSPLPGRIANADQVLCHLQAAKWSQWQNFDKLLWTNTQNMSAMSCACLSFLSAPRRVANRFVRSLTMSLAKAATLTKLLQKSKSHLILSDNQ